MRIRKRQVPLPLSSLLPVPLSDLYFNRPPPPTDAAVAAGDDLHHPPSDLSDRLIRRWSFHASPLSHRHEKNPNKDKPLGDKDFEEEEESDAVGSKNIVSGPETAVVNTSGESSSPSTQDNSSRATMSVNAEIKAKKCAGRKKARGGALAEGSRCSRVNGRGWRCCQQTLVGYSLCEHHLGKGRLRSMSESAKHALGNKNKEVGQQSSGSMTVTDAEEEEKITAAVGKKRVKLGMVKARSISSLLGQTSGGSEIVAPADQYGRCDK